MSSVLEQKIAVTVILADDDKIQERILLAMAKSVFRYPDPRVHIDIKFAHNRKELEEKFKEAKDTVALLIIDNAMPTAQEGEMVAAELRKTYTSKQLPIYLYTSTPPEDKQVIELFNKIFGNKRIEPKDRKLLTEQFQQIVETRLKTAGMTPIRLASPTLTTSPSANRSVSASPDSQSRSTVSDRSSPSVLLTPPPAEHKDGKHSERKHELKQSAPASPPLKTSGTLSGRLNVTSPSPGPILPPASKKDSKVSAKTHTLTIKEEEEKKAKIGSTNHNKPKTIDKSRGGT